MNPTQSKWNYLTLQLKLVWRNIINQSKQKRRLFIKSQAKPKPIVNPYACFPALGTGCVFFPANDTGRHRLHAFPRLTPVAYFPALGTGCVSPCLVPVACFPALGTSCMLSRAWHRLCFPALVTRCMFTALDTGCVVLLRVLIGS